MVGIDRPYIYGSETMATWLRCQVQPGQFSDEFVVETTDARGRSYSLFASEPDVDPEGWIKVTLLAHEGELCLIRLPQQTLENGSTISVQSRELRLARVTQEA